MRVALVTALVLCVLAAAAARADPALAPYREAERAGAVGVITGRVFAERRTPNGPDTPLVSATIVLLPRSEDFLATVETIRRGARDTPTAYRTAAVEIRKAREAYEKRLWQAGAADFVRPTSVGTDGAFRFDEVPAGRWMIVATHGTYYASGGSLRTPQRERRRFDVDPRLRGYTATLVWLREVQVSKDAIEQVELTDRNLWFSGVVEDKERDAGR